MSRLQRLLVITTLLLLLAFLPVAAQAVEAVQGEPEAITEPAVSPKKVSVLFATNRKPVKVAEPGYVFGGQRGEPAFGACEVKFKRIRGMEGIAQKVPFWVPVESSDQRIEVQVQPEAFWDRLVTAAKGTQTGKVVVFVHGYSYDFERACDRAAETQRVLGEQATVLMFTWPSNGRPTDYGSDQNDLEWSVPFLMTVLQELADRVDTGNVQVLAHSLGSRGIVEAMLGLKSDGLDEPLMDQLVFLAPDIDSGSFVELLPQLVSLSGDITLYASSNDTPLKLSRQLNGSPRLGQAGEFLTVAEGMETVDVTPAGRYQYLGHEYFYFHPDVVADLFVLLSEGKSAAERPGLRRKSKNGLSYWEVAERD